MPSFYAVPPLCLHTFLTTDEAPAFPACCLDANLFHITAQCLCDMLSLPEYASHFGSFNHDHGIQITDCISLSSIIYIPASASTKNSYPISFIRIREMLSQSPSASAPRILSAIACSSASASECPSSPISCSISTPPRISFLPFTS